ncbi:MAG: multicopper oxidase domain-containing protein [Deltaproteobacteria bacterium]|nr:multicopper oxidase domain-containing protein [Deltaproteobacteria bacterium]
MKKSGILVVMALISMVAIFPWGDDPAFGNTGPVGATWYANSPSGISPLGSDTGTALRKFVDSLPGISDDGGTTGANNLGQYIPLAVKDTATYPGCDYYKLGEVDYTEQVHSDLPGPLTVPPDPLNVHGTKFRGYVDLGTGSAPAPHYGGPLIVAERDRPVRVLVTNQLGTSTSPTQGHLPLPVDITLMGAGYGYLYNPTTGGGYTEYYTQNRTSLHLHGGFTSWISDGTPWQWFTPAGESNLYTKGQSFHNVPDMPDPGSGSETIYYTNQQSARLMFYHEHAVGITRLGVYAGMVGPYIIHDPVEDDLIDGTNNTGVNPTLAKIIPDQGGGVYKWGIPLIIQDKGFVPKDVHTVQDDKWDTLAWGTYGDLWFPHIYEPNQNLSDPSGLNPYGRWDFGPWVQPNILDPDDPPPPVSQAVLPLPSPADVNNPQNYPTSATPEAFMDVMMVNGTVFPYLEVEPKAYRFRILNGSNGRFLNLQLYQADTGGGSGATATASVDIVNGIVSGITITSAGAGYTSPPPIVIRGGGGSGATATATVASGVIAGITLTNGGRGYTSVPTVDLSGSTEVKMVPAAPNGSYPPTWPTDGRDGGVPDPFTAGPKFYMIGTEGGILPGVAVRDNQPVNYDYDRGSATVLNVQNLEGADPAIKGVTILLGPAERADVIVDFSGFAGKNIILYNDAPTPIPGFQPRYDYYTGNEDLTETGGAPSTLPGYGPNTRTIMQFRVKNTTPVPFNLIALQNALPDAYVASQPPPIVPEMYYPVAYQPADGMNHHASINATSLTYTPLGSTVPKTLQAKQKAIVEQFGKYGRLTAVLGYEVFDPTANPARSNGIGFSYIDPPAEIFRRGEIQLWKVTHNGVDTHPIHIHLNNAQIINRVGWDGTIKPPEPYERGWKETIRMNPLEVIFIAQKADLPTPPFAVPYSIRPYSPSQPLGSTADFTNIDPKTGQPITTTPTVNSLYNFGHEYVWHCHILGHEENDMMRPIKVTGVVAPGTLDLLLLF